MHVRAFGVALALGVAACAAAPPLDAGPPLPAVSPAAAAQARPALLALNLGAPDALTLEAALAALGPADIDRREGQGAILTWRLDGCALILAFAADPQGRLRAQVAEAGPRRAGTPPAPLAQCLAEAQAR